jgi:hypothetical protein
MLLTASCAEPVCTKDQRFSRQGTLTNETEPPLDAPTIKHQTILRKAGAFIYIVCTVLQ